MEINIIESPQKGIPYNDKLFGIEWIEIDLLTVDPSYQRAILEAHVKQIANNWDWKAVRTLAVSLRQDNDGNNYYTVIDGQQRLTAARRVEGIDKLPCQVYIDLTTEEEASLFRQLNSAKKPSANDMFRAALAAGDQSAKLIMTCLHNTNWTLRMEGNGHKNSSDYCNDYITSAQALQKEFSRGGAVHLMSVLNVLSGFKGKHLAGGADMITGVGQFLHRYGKQIDMSTLTQKLAAESPDSILGAAGQYQRILGGGGSRSASVVAVLVKIYNKSIKNPSKRIGPKEEDE